MEEAAESAPKNASIDRQSPVQSKDEASNLDPKDRLRRSQRKIELLQQNLRTKVNLATVESYKQRLKVPTQISYFRDLNENVALKSFDEEFLSRHNLEKDLSIQEKEEVKPRYSKTVSELEKRWSGKFLDLKRNSSESSKSSYVEEIESLSSIEDSSVAKNLEDKSEEVEKDDSTIPSTIGSTSCLEDKIVGVEEEIEKIEIADNRWHSLGDDAIQLSENPNLEVSSSQKNAYANFLQEFTMDQNAKCQKKEEEKKKKKSGLRRLLPGLFSPKESRKEYKENRERRKRDERYFCRYQQNGNYTMSPDSMNLNDDISRNIPLDKMNSERKQELYVNHRGPVTPDHNPQLRHVFEESYNVSARLQTPVMHYDEALIDQNMINRSSDGKKPRQHGWRQYEDKKCNLERKHSFQEQNQSRFVRNHVPSGRISAPPSERFLIRPRAVHPVERPLPAIPQRLEFSYENQEKVNVQLGMYDHSRLQNQRMVSFSKYSPSSSQRSGDYDDSNYTPNSSQKSEFSPGSSKSGEYYLGSSRTSNCTSPSCFDKIEQIYDVEEGETSPVVMVHSVPDRIYDETPRNVEMQIVDMNLEPEDEDRNKTLIKTCVDVEVQKEVPESNKSETESQSWKEESPRKITSPLTIIAPENGIFGARRGSTPTSPVRRAQPGDQILIASPKRALYESQERCGSSPSTTNSPIPIADSPSQMLDSKQAYLKPTISKRVDYKTAGKSQREMEMEMARRRYNGSQTSTSPSPGCYQDQQDYLKHDQIYARRTPEPRPVAKQSSPSKKETMQHLEAFYWQQKALEAQKKSPQVRAPEGKVPEVIYWQRLKKMDEEQQKKIYQQNMGRHESAPNLVMQQYRQLNYEQVYWKNEVRVPVGKPPIMTPKGQNQPVLVVRPQPAMQDVMNKFARNGERRSLSLPRRPETDRVHRSPKSFEDRTLPPIFKRGSLVSNGCQVEYGTMGTKRVSFSSPEQNQMDERKWPTKRGMAVEPPTRKHRTEESEADGNERQAFDSPEYANKPLPPPPESLYASKNQQKRWPTESESGSDGGEVQTILQRADNENRGFCHAAPSVPVSKKMCSKCCECCQGSRHSIDASPTSETDSEDSEEEWNPNGKGRQSNDGSGGRVDGEGSNELPGNRRGGSGGGVLGGRGPGASGGRSRDEPRRHTLSGDHQPSLHHQQFNSSQALHPLHPHHLPPAHMAYATTGRSHTTMDLEMGMKSRQRKSPLARGYPPPSSNMLFDDDPGIMSEVETSSTGFRRGGKQRSSLPVVRTPSKTLERPLGLVFLQYRNETKRALLPNEITSIDTVKALFVRSFPKQLTMEYLDSPHVKVYIHDSNKDMFYELEDLRSHLRDIRDRSVLRLFESTDGATSFGPGPLGVPGGGSGLPPHWEDQSYFSEPEFDSEYQHQHIHKSKNTKNASTNSYYMASSTLPRSGPLLRAYSPATSIVGGPNSTTPQPKSLTTPDRLHGESGYMSSPERGGGVGPGTGRYASGLYSTGSSYEDPYYSQYSGTVTPVIDEEASDTELMEETYSLYGVKPPGRPPPGPPRSPFPSGVPPHPPGQPCDVTRIKVEDVARQIANLTGLVQKVLTHSPSTREYLQVPGGRDIYSRSAGSMDEYDNQSVFSSASVPPPDNSYLMTDGKPPKLGKDKSVSFEKSVSFSDEPPDMNSPKQHSPQHAADTKPTKPAIKSSTLPRMSSQERERHKPMPSPKPDALVGGPYVYRGDLTLTPEMYNQLRGLQKKAKDLRQEVRNLRRMSQAQAHTVRETIRDTFITIRAMLLSGRDAVWNSGDTDKIRLSREEDLYKQEMLWLEKDLTGLESTVEELRGNVINRKTRVNMSDVENMALILSKASKTVADLKMKFPSLQEGLKGLLSSEMEKVMREEKFLKEEPERLESALKRCKKLTGTLVTLKRLASVQEQRLPNSGSVDTEETPPITPTTAQHSKTTAPVPAERTVVGSAVVAGGIGHADPSATHQQRPENALDALLDELQTFSRPTSALGQVPEQKNSMDTSVGLTISTGMPGGSLRRLHSYPSSSDTDTSPPIGRAQENNSAKGAPPAVPERNAELLQMAQGRRVPPPPPPRTSSRSPLASPTSPQLPPRNPTQNATGGTLRRTRKDAKPPMALPSQTPPTVSVTSAPTEDGVPPSTQLVTSNSSSCESINSQEGLQKKGRQEQLEQRHQELLRKQKALQEQYARLQQLQRNTSGLATIPPTPPDLLKKTGSESNLLAKMGLGLSTANSGSLTSLTMKPVEKSAQNGQPGQLAPSLVPTNNGQPTMVNKIYETDIL